MTQMVLGQILVAEHEGVHVIKMVGDVRLTLCVSFDEYITLLFGNNDFCSILFDLSEGTCLDSTTLGLIAKIAIKSEQLKSVHPIIICENHDVLSLLSSMAINTVCDIIAKPQQDYCSSADFSNLSVCDDKENLVKEKVLEAHCVLMSLNETNHETFKDLVRTLESQ